MVGLLPPAPIGSPTGSSRGLVRVLGFWGERCAAIVALSCGRQYSSVVGRPCSVWRAAARMWRRHSIGERFAKAELYMLHRSLDGFRGKLLVLMMMGICFLSLFRMSAWICVEILVSRTGTVHLACRLARSRRL